MVSGHLHDRQGDQMITDQVTNELHKRAVLRRERNETRKHIQERETDQDIRDAMQSASASSYVFTVQNYQWEIQS